MRLKKKTRRDYYLIFPCATINTFSKTVSVFHRHALTTPSYVVRFGYLYLQVRWGDVGCIYGFRVIWMVLLL